MPTQLKPLVWKRNGGNYSTFTLKNLAKDAGINEHKLKNGFKELFGQPVFVHIREQRLLLAKKLLQETRLDETAIAKKAGYKTLSGFIKAFTKKYNSRGRRQLTARSQ